VCIKDKRVSYFYLIPFLFTHFFLCSRYITDLQTFKSVTGFEYADGKYAKVLPYDSQTGMWAFDPYQKFYKTNEEMEDLLIKKERQPVTRTLTSINVFEGDILFTPTAAGSGGIYLGHTAGIYSLPPACGTLALLMSGTTVIEADKSNLLSGQVYKRGMSVFWSGLTVRLLQYCNVVGNGLTSSQRTTIVNYLNTQVGEPYSLIADKWDQNAWYCSKLVWRAYMYAGFDIDYDGGDFVFPMDIVNCSNINQYYLN
jgi:uncharacterized protein YycO